VEVRNLTADKAPNGAAWVLIEKEGEGFGICGRAHRSAIDALLCLGVEQRASEPRIAASKTWLLRGLLSAQPTPHSGSHQAASRRFSGDSKS
jgi:hypothetical protein